MDAIDDKLYQLTRPLQKISPVLVEFYGTFFLVLVWCCSTGTAFQPFAIAAILISQIFSGGHISGGHYNPAVTIGVFLSGRRKIGLVMAIAYIVSQVLASVFAALIAWGLARNQQVYWCTSTDYNTAQQFLAETLIPIALVYTVISVATTKSQDGNSFFGLAIGLVILAGADVFGGVSCGFFNPAVGTGPLIVAAIANDSSAMKLIWIAWLAPILGGIIGSIFFRLTNPREYGKGENRERDLQDYDALQQ